MIGRKLKKISACLYAKINLTKRQYNYGVDLFEKGAMKNLPLSDFIRVLIWPESMTKKHN